MTDKVRSESKPRPPRDAVRLAREAAALRENLRRRKEQARRRQESGEKPAPAPEAGPD